MILKEDAHIRHRSRSYFPQHCTVSFSKDRRHSGAVSKTYFAMKGCIIPQTKNIFPYDKKCSLDKILKVLLCVIFFFLRNTADTNK